MMRSHQKGDTTRSPCSKQSEGAEASSLEGVLRSIVGVAWPVVTQDRKNTDDPSLSGSTNRTQTSLLLIISTQTKISKARVTITQLPERGGPCPASPSPLHIQSDTLIKTNHRPLIFPHPSGGRLGPAFYCLVRHYPILSQDPGTT